MTPSVPRRGRILRPGGPPPGGVAIILGAVLATVGRCLLREVVTVEQAGERLVELVRDGLFAAFDGLQPGHERARSSMSSAVGIRSG